MNDKKTDQIPKYEEDMKYALMRREMLDALRQDLIGPTPNDGENGYERDPDEQYVTGKLFSKLYEDTPSIPSAPNTCGLYCYVTAADISNLTAVFRWATYEKKDRDFFMRSDHSESILFSNVEAECWIELKADSNISFKVSLTAVDDEYQMLSVFLSNNRPGNNRPGDTASILFQVGIELSEASEKPVFVPENVCRGDAYKDDEMYHSHPVYARGHNCAATWRTGESPLQGSAGAKAVRVETAFIPDYEINGVSPAIQSLSEKGIELNAQYFYTNDKDVCIQTLTDFNRDYQEWIDHLGPSESMPDLIHEGDSFIDPRQEAHDRIQNGIEKLATYHDAWHAFQFMNQVMYLQNAISSYSGREKPESNVCFEKFLDAHQDTLGRYTWRPFQLAFILLNIESITNPLNSTERDIVDLLYFPTGGGKTEAYLGLIAFTAAYRRLTRNRITNYEKDYEKDGGVTVFLRYTLRLLTKQQRDRITKMVLAAELVRQNVRNKNSLHVYGEEPFSIGFWVGSKNTPNSFSEYPMRKRNGEFKGRGRFQEKIHKQLSACPFCGREFEIGEMDQLKTYPDFKNNYKLWPDKDKESPTDLKIYCTNPNCYFTEAKKHPIPVYLIDDQIYQKCPTVVIATVDKFARLPSEAMAKRLFGRRNDGTKYTEKDFYPPELIIQDELHLITGSLGSMYGCYETLVEELCTISCGEDKIKPKYVVCTATIENVETQIRALYGREHIRQFPPPGLDVSDSYFSRELALPSHSYKDYGKEENGELNLDESLIQRGEKPFRQYVGVCGSGMISGQDTVARVYAVLFQKFYELYISPKYDPFHYGPDYHAPNPYDPNHCDPGYYIDPYFTLVGFFTTIRELGAMVWELVDPDKIPDMIKKVFDYLPDSLIPRELKDNKQQELTSRLDTEEIPEILENLGRTLTDPDSYDVVLATNMIAVGMDIDRLGLMVLTGAPKSNSEYIQASSRVGRKYPGLVITVYNQGKQRDISYYENFSGFHAQMYHNIDGSTASAFSEGARARVLHAILVSLVRLQNARLNLNSAADGILFFSDALLQSYQDIICERVGRVAGKEAKDAAEKELASFVEDWKNLAEKNDMLFYNKEKNQPSLLISYQADNTNENETARPTLSSMRDVEREIKLYLRRNV